MLLLSRLLPALAALPALSLAAAAFSPTLTDAEVEQAYRKGADLAGSTDHGYTMADWVLWDQDKPMEIAPGEGIVEAVIVRTPFENVRYTSYLDHWSNQTFSESDAADLARSSAETLRFVVYAHSPHGAIGVPEFVNEQPPGEGRDFLEHFVGASFTLADGRTLAPSERDIFGPAQDFYRLAQGGNELRWLGYVAFVFDLSQLDRGEGELSDLKGTFAFTDATGADHSYEVDLGAFH